MKLQTCFSKTSQRGVSCPVNSKQQGVWTDERARSQLPSILGSVHKHEDSGTEKSVALREVNIASKQ